MPQMTEPDLFAAAQRVAEASEKTAARAMADTQEAEIVRRVTADLFLVASFTADDIGALLDTMAVKRENDLRRRLVSTVVNRGKGKWWTKAGSTMGSAGRPITVWNTVRD